MDSALYQISLEQVPRAMLGHDKIETASTAVTSIRRRNDIEIIHMENSLIFS